MALSFEQFKEARSKGLSPEQIARFESGNVPIQPEATQGIGDAVGKGFRNIGESIRESGEGVADVLQSRTSPFVKTMGVFGKMLKPFTQIGAEAVMTPARVAGEAIEGVTGKDVNSAVARKFEQAVQKGMDTKTAREAVKLYERTIEGNPEAETALGAILDLADFATIGAGGAKAGQMAGKQALKGGKAIVDPSLRAGKAVGKTTGDVAEFATAQTFGLNTDTIKQVIKNPDIFTPKEMAKIDSEAIFNKVKKTVDQRIQDLSGTGKEYNKIKNLNKNINISEDVIKNTLREKGIDVVDGRVVSNLGSDIVLSEADSKALSSVLDRLKGKQTLTPKEVLNLRKELSVMSGFGEGKTDASKLVAKELRKKIDNIAKEEIPGLKDLDARFSSEIQTLRGVRDKIFKKNGELKDNAVSVIANLTGKNKQKVLERFKKLIPGIEEDLNILKAIEDISGSQGQKVGTYFRSIAGAGGGAALGGPVGAVIGALATSPKVAVSLLRAYGKLKNISKPKIDGVIKNMRSGKKLIGEQKKIMDEAVDNAVKKAGSRVKNIKPGLSIKDISARGAEFRKAYERLSRQWDKASGQQRKVIEKAIQKLIDNNPVE